MFYIPRNNAFSLLTQTHIVGDGELVVSDATLFGSPTSLEPIKVTCGPAIMAVDEIIGNTLMISDFLEGTSDTELPINSVVQINITALDISSLQDAVKAFVSDKTYIHTQGVPSDTWTINHNLNKYPSVAVVDSAGSVVFGDERYINLNTVELIFGGAFGGKAYLN